MPCEPLTVLDPSAPASDLVQTGTEKDPEGMNEDGLPTPTTRKKEWVTDSYR